MKKISLLLLTLSLIIIVSLALPMSMMTNYRAIPFAYAQTNAAMLTALTANNTTTSTTATSNNSTEGLQIKTGVNYFDSSSGYLVYPSSTSSSCDNDS